MATNNAQDSVVLPGQCAPISDSLNYFHNQHGGEEEQPLAGANSQPQEPEPIQATARNQPPIVYLDGVGMDYDEADRNIRAKFIRMMQLYDKEKENYTSQIEALKSEIESLNSEKAAFTQQFTEAKDQLKKFIEDGNTKAEQLNVKDEQLIAKEEELKSRDNELSLKERELNDITENFQARIDELSNKLAAEESEFNNSMQKLQQKKDELEKELKESIAEVKRLKTEKDEAQQQLEHAKGQLATAIKDGHAKDEQLSAKEERLRLEESKSSDLAQELQTKVYEASEKLAAKENEFSSNMQKLQQKNDELEKELKENTTKREAEIERLKAEKMELEQQLATAKGQLDGHAKHVQQAVKEKEGEAKEKMPKLELAERVQTKPTKPTEHSVARENDTELSDNMQKVQQRKSEELKEKVAELKVQNETLKRDKEAKELELKYEIMIRDQELMFSKERQQMKDKQHQLELQVAGASRNGDATLRGNLSEGGKRTNENDGQGDRQVAIPKASDKVTIAGPSITFWTKQVLGGGAFGKVYAGERDGKPCAVKILNEVAMELISEIPTSSRDGPTLQKAIESFTKEGECLKQIKHKNIVELYNICPYPKGNYPVIVMEKLRCSLTDFFTPPDRQDVSPVMQLSFSCDVAAALEYLHHRDIIHRDLCGDNILLDDSAPIPVAKVSDFGMSRIFKLTDFERMSAKLTALGNQRTAYYPPEVQDDPESYDMSIDIFMFGVIMLQIAHKIPYVKSPKRRRERIHELSESYPLKKHIQECVQEKNKRPPVKDVHTELKKIYENFLSKDQLPQAR